MGVEEGRQGRRKKETRGNGSGKKEETRGNGSGKKDEKKRNKRRCPAHQQSGPPLPPPLKSTLAHGITRAEAEEGRGRRRETEEVPKETEGG